MYRDIALPELLSMQTNGPLTMVDVRSPKEFVEATIPGSINIPVFDDEERAEIGTLYKQVGTDEAKVRGLEIFSRKLPQFIAEFKKIETPIAVFCWRGGMRSKTAVTVLDLMGIHAKRLSGGVRTYRQWVVQELEKEQINPDLLVLNGYTGSGKTLLLKKLKQIGKPVIDLEEMAGHRGSIFGQIGLESSNQKKFDSLLLTQLKRFDHEQYVFIEGESRRIGKVCLPQFFNDKKERGIQLFIDLPVEVRVKNILDEYTPWDNPTQFTEAFQMIKKHIHTPIAKKIEDDLVNEKFDSAVKLLLENYYDPKYEYSAKQYNDQQVVHIPALDVEDAFTQVKAVIERMK